MDQRDAPAVVDLRDDLVAEHRPGVRRRELLDVRAAQAACDDTDERARPPGLGHVRERRLSVRPDDHRAHGRSLWPRRHPGSHRRYTSSSAGL
jgi:hypothetical protein